MSYPTPPLRPNRIWEPWSPNHTSQRVEPPRASDCVDYDLITSPANLVEVCKWLRAKKSDAPGPDGIRLSQLTNQEIWALMHALSQVLRDGSYRPGEAREVAVPKRKGGFRTIRIRGLFDRIVSAALYFALDPVLDRNFRPMSHGSRRGHSSMTMLAMMHYTIQQTGHAWLLNADVYHAYDEVPRTLAINSFRPYITSPRLMSLIEVVLRGDGAQLIGIDQGGAFSPLVFNNTMNTLFDFWISPHAPPLAYRYLDNLVAHCASERETRLRIRDFTRALRNGHLRIKDPTVDDPITVDLRSTSTVLLGFALSLRGNELHLSVPEPMWADLDDDLREAFSKRSSPTVSAMQLCRSWCDYFGPGLPDPDAAVHRIVALLRSYGVRDGIPRDKLYAAIHQSRQAWVDSLEHTATSFSGGAPVMQPSELHLSGPLMPAPF